MRTPEFSDQFKVLLETYRNLWIEKPFEREAQVIFRKPFGKIAKIETHTIHMTQINVSWVFDTDEQDYMIEFEYVGSINFYNPDGTFKEGKRVYCRFRKSFEYYFHFPRIWERGNYLIDNYENK